ncbi:tetratricopeptide repeat protein [Fulvimarina sp. MAC3]|uniref:tetratricopeptide repeat protein n=1 Tax=Fulvimarina sp. MAC3 TaxID=3148887 RepID=UPI0031FC1720
MSDESFFREVSEELRQDRIKSIWTRFGTVIISVIVAIILLTVAYVGWERYSIAEANASGDRYLAAQDLVAAGDTDAAIEAFRAIAADGWGAYPDLARMSIANAEAQAGRIDQAIASYGEVAADGSIPSSMREMADLRAAYLLVDQGSLTDVRARAERLTGDDNPLRYAARDAIALAAWKAGETETARDLYQSILDAGDAPGGISQRAGLIIGLLNANQPSQEQPAAASEETDTSDAQSDTTDSPPVEEQEPAPQSGTQDANDEIGSAPETTPAPANVEPSTSQSSEPAPAESPTPQDTDAASASTRSETGEGQTSGNAVSSGAGTAADSETVILPEPQADQGTETNQ